MRHFDHGYAVTSHSSQGLTSKRVLINMDTEVHPQLINGRFAYVSVSRASDDAQVFTNDASNLAQRLCREVSKTSAVTFSNTEFRIPTLTPEQVKTTRKTPAAGLELAL